MRALVTGAGGFVGRYLVTHLQTHGDEVLGITLPDSGRDMPCETDCFDILDLEACRRVISSFRPNVIYHLAGIAFVPEAEEDFQKALNINVMGTNNIFRVTHLLDLECKIIFISSAEVYGKITPSQLPITEDTPLAPANNYSLSKAMAELVAKRYSVSGKVSHVTVRPFNHIGPGQDSRFAVSNFARQLAQIKQKRMPPQISVGNLDARRDFTDVRDIVRAYRLAAVKGKGIYNFASGRSISVRSILDLLITVSGLNVEIKQDPSRIRPIEIPELYADITKAKNELGWQPEFEIRDTLQDIYNYWVEKEAPR
jgi:GDP-4-dehydro-6-deoxy-D-mannose reductase